MKKFLVFLLATVLVGQFSFAAKKVELPGDTPPAIQAFPERSPGVFNVTAYINKQNELFNRLMAEHVAIPPRDMVAVQVTQSELDEIWNYKCEACGSQELMRKKIRCGVVKGVDLAVEFDNLTMASIRKAPQRVAGGVIHGTPDGGFVWNITATSDGAACLRVHFADFYLPLNTEAYVYSDAGQAFGPYTLGGLKNRGDFWANTVSGSLVNIQVRHVGPATDKDLRGIRFTIKELGHITGKFTRQFERDSDLYAPAEFCGDNAPCVVDASCYSGGPVGTLEDAVAYIQWVSGVWIYMCSGGLLTDTDPNTQIPYFLTANHCISKDRDAANLECYFQFKTSSCGGACYDPEGNCPRTLGADIISTNKTSDYSLLRLQEDPPAGSAFLGWYTTPVAFNHGYNLYRVSHPAGSPQAYSEHYVDTEKGVCSSWPRGGWIYSTDTLGATEGGSSGSPVVNGNAQVVGQLSGGCGTNVYEVCDYESNATVDGAFANYYDTVKEWLDPGQQPGDNMHVQSIVLSVEQQAVFYTAVATVTIVDEGGQPVANATVSGTFSGDISDSASAVTDSNGVAVVKSNKTKGGISSFTFCVDNVTHATFNYDSGANVETCDTY